MNKELFRLLAVTEKSLVRLDADWAIGGALAMGAHGYVRETEDIDVFIAPEAREALLAELTKRSLPLITIAEDIHYALPTKGGPNERVDLMFPYSEPDVSAVAVPDYADVGGKRRPVWPLSLIIVNKLMSDREKDKNDLLALRARGLVDGREVLEILGHMGEEHAIARLRALVQPRRQERDDDRGPPRRRR